MTPAGRGRLVIALLALWCTWWAWPLDGRVRPASLRGIEGLARVYDAILDARFDQAEAELARACGPAPREACDVLAATALWWQIQLDPESRALDELFSEVVEHAIETTEAWVGRAPEDAEAWFYMGGAYAARVQWRVLRDEKLAAARDGRRIHRALTQTLALDPGLDDAYFALGMYKYYADVAPTAARIVRALLFLPGGNRVEGLEEMVRARDRGRLLQGEADYQIHLVYLWYEGRIAEALDLLRGLHKEYPGNPLFLAQIAEVQDRYQHDVAASMASWRALLAAAREQRVNSAPLAQTQARLAIARHLETLHQTDHAIEHLDAVIAGAPRAPHGALALAHLRVGQAHDRLGSREAALAAYRAAIVTTAHPDPYNVRAQAADRMRRAPNPTRAEAYRLSLDGFRLLEEKDVTGAAAALARSIALDPRSPVARYRYGRVLQAQKEDGAALEQYARAIALRADAPAVIVGNAYLEAARLYERAGRMPDAIGHYQIASTLFGAASETHAAAERALARLHAR